MTPQLLPAHVLITIQSGRPTSQHRSVPDRNRSRPLWPRAMRCRPQLLAVPAWTLRQTLAAAEAVPTCMTALKAAMVALWWWWRCLRRCAGQLSRRRWPAEPPPLASRARLSVRLQACKALLSSSLLPCPDENCRCSRRGRPGSAAAAPRSSCPNRALARTRSTSVGRRMCWAAPCRARPACAIAACGAWCAASEGALWGVRAGRAAAPVPWCTLPAVIGTARLLFSNSGPAFAPPPIERCRRARASRTS